jgi:hypothetical protein
MSSYRFQKDPPFYYEEEEDSSARNAVLIAIGAAAGFAAGVLMAERFGGFKGLTDRLKDSFGGGGTEGDEEEDFDYEGLDEDEFDPDFEDAVDGATSLDGAEELEERVLEAFRNDPTLSERAIDIGALEDGIIELTGWVNSDEESRQAVAVATGTPGVETVVNRLSIRRDEELFDEGTRRYEEGDPTFAEPHWEGQQVGTGRRRQGTSAEIDRHADPRNVLEDRSLKEDKAFMAAADEIPETAERRKTTKKGARGGRTDGSPVAPTGVPKADHVADPESAPATNGTRRPSSE